jgi:hypothetical protein
LVQRIAYRHPTSNTRSRANLAVKHRGINSRCAECCVAVAAKQANFRPWVSMSPATLDPGSDQAGLHPRRNAHGSLRNPTIQPCRKMIFVKEAVYKAQYPLTGAVIGFQAVTLKIDTNCVHHGCLHRSSNHERRDLDPKGFDPYRPPMFKRIAFVCSCTRIRTACSPWSL